MISPENILRHEMIGLEIEIVESSNKDLLGILGKIVFERRNVLLIESGGKKRCVPKEIVHKMKINLISGVCFISGSALIGRPEDRTIRKS
jgi:ribonuclease P protein subunit POP4